MLRTFFITLCFLSFAFNVILYPWHIRFANVPGLSVLSWLTMASLVYGINASVFNGDALLVAPYYCDLVTKVLVGTQMGVSISMMCYAVQYAEWLLVCRSDRQKTKRLVHRSSFHVALCVGAPIVYMCLHVAAQGHRFDIIEDFGCIPSTEVSMLSFIIIWILPILPCCVTLFYGVTTLRYLRLYNRLTPAYQTTFEKLNSDLYFTKAPYGIYRILRMSTIAFLIVIYITLTPILPIAIFARSGQLTAFKRPDLSRIDLFHSYADASSGAVSMQLYLWSIPVFSILFFLGNVDSDVLGSFPFLFRKLVLKRPTTKPDPSPGIDGSKLTPVPETESSSSDPFSDIRHSLVLPMELHEGDTMAKAKLLMEDILQVMGNDLNRPAPIASVPEDIELGFGITEPSIEPKAPPAMPSPPKQVLKLHENPEFTRRCIRNGGGTPPVKSESEGEAWRKLSVYVSAGFNFPMYDIPESPRSIVMSINDGITNTPDKDYVEIPSPTESVYAEVIPSGITISDAFEADSKPWPAV